MENGFGANELNSLVFLNQQNTAAGLQSVKEITQKLGLTGVYGPLFELFTCDNIFKTAIEVIAGNK